MPRPAGDIQSPVAGPSNWQVAARSRVSFSFETDDQQIESLGYAGIDTGSYQWNSSAFATPQPTNLPFSALEETCPLLTLTLDSLIRPQLEIFFTRIFPMIPVYTRAEILARLEYDLQDRTFVALVLSMSALSLVHPLEASEMPQKPMRSKQAAMLLDEACRLSARWDYGCNATIENVLTSYLMFGTLFELGHASGARMRLRESISMGEGMRLDDAESYAGISAVEARRRMRMYWILAVTER